MPLNTKTLIIVLIFNVALSFKRKSH